jgi:hypothetical protein
MYLVEQNEFEDRKTSYLVVETIKQLNELVAEVEAAAL